MITVHTYTSLLSVTNETLDMEMQTIVWSIPTLNDKSTDIVHFTHQSSDKVIVTGMGQNAFIGQMQMTIFHSTDTHTSFPYTVDAVSGDLNIFQQPDIELCLTQSGHMPEIIKILPIIQGFDHKNVGLSAVKYSFLYLEDKYLEMNQPVDSTHIRIVTTKRFSICSFQ